MRRLIVSISIGILLLTSGCWKDEDGYSLSDIYLSFGVVKQLDTNSSVFTIVTDEGEILDPVAFGNHYGNYFYGYEDSYAKWKNGDRVMVNFTVLDDKTDSQGRIEKYFIRVNSIKKILTKRIIDITPEITDSIGNDPITVIKTWVTDSLLNFKLKYYGKYKTHYINLVKEPGVITSASLPVQLELRHNDNDDAESYPMIAYVTFKLTNLKVQGLDSIKFVVKAKEFDGNDFVFSGTYRY